MTDLKKLSTPVSLSKQIAARIALPILSKRKTYQPVSLGGHSMSAGGRHSHTRWREIEKIIDRDNIRSVLDIGCSEGFFVRKAVEKGCFATGVDADPDKLIWANTTLSLDGLNGFSFTKLAMTPDNLHLLSPADLVINMSVIHHLMYDRGQAYAQDFMKKLKQLTRKVMVFEMGQSDEIHYSWAKLLPDMGADPHSWIMDFLKQCGFAEIKLLCKVESHKGNVSRAIFAAYV